MPRNNYRALNTYKGKLLDRISNVDPKLAESLRAVKLDWYRIKNEAPADGEEAIAEVFIYDEIGGSFGISADEFVKDLQGIKEDKISVRINSPGGSVFDSIAIYNALVQHKAHVTVYVDALAASGASIIAMAGDDICMMVGSQLMIHDALGMEAGNEKDFREMADFLGRQSDNIATIYANKAGGEPQEWRDLMLAETWMFATEAVDFGLADRVYTPPSKTEMGDEEEPGETDPEEEDEELDEEDAEESEEITALMKTRHRLTNRGYKHSGRVKAGSPWRKAEGVSADLTPKRTPTDDEIDRFVAAFSNTLGGK